jgi:hypothetical protein
MHHLAAEQESRYLVGVAGHTSKSRELLHVRGNALSRVDLDSPTFAPMHSFDDRPELSPDSARVSWVEERDVSCV